MHLNASKKKSEICGSLVLLNRCLLLMCTCLLGFVAVMMYWGSTHSKLVLVVVDNPAVPVR